MSDKRIFKVGDDGLSTWSDGNIELLADTYVLLIMPTLEDGTLYSMFPTPKHYRGHPIDVVKVDLRNYFTLKDASVDAQNDSVSESSVSEDVKKEEVIIKEEVKQAKKQKPKVKPSSEPAKLNTETLSVLTTQLRSYINVRNFNDPDWCKTIFSNDIMDVQIKYTVEHVDEAVKVTGKLSFEFDDRLMSLEIGNVIRKEESVAKRDLLSLFKRTLQSALEEPLERGITVGSDVLRLSSIDKSMMLSVLTGLMSRIIDEWMNKMVRANARSMQITETLVSTEKTLSSEWLDVWFKTSTNRDIARILNTLVTMNNYYFIHRRDDDTVWLHNMNA